MSRSVLHDVKLTVNQKIKKEKKRPLRQTSYVLCHLLFLAPIFRRDYVTWSKCRNQEVANFFFGGFDLPFQMPWVSL